MSVRAAHIHPGMAVYGNDGTKVGSVTEVWAETDAYGHVPKSRHELADYGPVAGTSHHMETGSGYIEVSRGTALNSDPNLRIPLDAIREHNGEDSITVDCSSTECIDRYTARPQTL